LRINPVKELEKQVFPKREITASGAFCICPLLMWSGMKAAYSSPSLTDSLTMVKRKCRPQVAIQKKLLVLMYTLWKNDTPYESGYQPKAASGDLEPKSLFPVDSKGVLAGSLAECLPAKEAALTGRATQDELPCDSSPEALFPVKQNY
jgi:hypothetical protein